jgi:hypothetical protein
MRGIGSVLGNGGEKGRLAMKPATAQEGIALLRTAELHLHTVQLCIDQLTVLEACAALRTLAVRLQALSLRAGESCDAPAMADVADEMAAMRDRSAANGGST